MTDQRPALASTLLLLAVLAWIAAPGAAQQTAATGVTLPQIMAHPDWIGNAPESAYWADDGEAVYFSQKRQGEELRDLWRIDLSGATPGEPEKVEDAERGEISVPGGEWDDARRHKVYEREGDIYLRDLSAGTVRQLTRTAARESSPQFLADGRVAFERDDAVVARDLATGLETQLADLRFEKDPAEVEAKAEEDEGYLGRQQERLFEIIRKQERDETARRERDRAEQAADPTRAPMPWYLGEGKRLLSQSLAPSGRHLLLLLENDKRDRGQQDSMPVWVTETGYVQNRDVRSKVGTGDGSGMSLVLLDLETHERHDVDPTTLPGIDEEPLAAVRALQDDAGEDDAEKGTSDASDDGEATADGGVGAEADDEAEPRNFDFYALEWNESGDRLAVMVASVDNKDRWIAEVDLESGALVGRHRLQDEAWIGWDFNEMGWVGDDLLWYLSEETGTSHLYVMDAAGDRIRRDQLTGTGTGTGDDGDFLVSDVVLSPDQKHFYFEANRGDPGVYEVYRVPVAGGEMERLTDHGGRLDFALSPNGDELLVTASTALHPEELYVTSATSLGEARRLTDTVSAEFLAVDWIEPQFVQVPSSHQKDPIHSRVYVPRDFDPERAEPYPAVAFVHGAGYLQNAHKGWSGYFREFMFHTLLAEHGYVVIDMDYRGSAGYGRDWRTAIYRRMGTPELEDYLDGIDWLVDHRNVDRDRVGIYGGSYGGFMTFMALFKEPGTFAAGAALRPVTDWAHYNHGYTSNILNTPSDDPDAYERSSPIELAEGLDDPLLIIHGMLDDNVFFEDSVRLVQRLIELEKEDWEIAIYPVEPHGFQQPSSWLDAYRRIFRLFEENVKPTPRDPGMEN
jgi:dipeptidyl aminopeptidase/acylaminoacyl peptidase